MSGGSDACPSTTLPQRCVELFDLRPFKPQQPFAPLFGLLHYTLPRPPGLVGALNVEDAVASARPGRREVGDSTVSLARCSMAVRSSLDTSAATVLSRCETSSEQRRRSRSSRWTFSSSAFTELTAACEAACNDVRILNNAACCAYSLCAFPTRSAKSRTTASNSLTSRATDSNSLPVAPNVSPHSRRF